MRKPVMFAATVVLAGGLGTGAALAATNHSADPPAERQAETRYTDAHRGEATVSQTEAESAALARHSGTIIDTHLEDEGHGLRWEVKPDDGTRVWEVQVDAHTGNVVSDHADD
jgi:uncharacterized membrane protein YkoI